VIFHIAHKQRYVCGVSHVGCYYMHEYVTKYSLSQNKWPAVIRILCRLYNQIIQFIENVLFFYIE